MYLFRKEQIIQYIPVATVCLVHNPLLLFQISFFFPAEKSNKHPAASVLPVLTRQNDNKDTASQVP